MFIKNIAVYLMDLSIEIQQGSKAMQIGSVMFVPPTLDAISALHIGPQYVLWANLP